ncbi:unnamed protein product [Menidia menidia]|uniref:(Atlantic silverside) hypothetical protein n=1 Tax=Menidia menidia TaxID=238744 RepID=A0A8S4B661_9TELE|nr:unnamed protein product [Menidia menidia]
MKRFMGRTLRLGLTLFLTLCVDILEAGGTREGANAESKRSSRSTDTKAGRCSYTFIVPQQKLTGALCLNTQTAQANRSEVAALQTELKRQQEQLEKLQRQLEHEGSLATEVRALRKESNNMNARIAQLYAQLLHEVIHKKDQAFEQQRVESLLLNATTQVSSNYKELEKKYGAMTSTMSSQNQLIAQLEKQCQCKDSSQSSLHVLDSGETTSGIYLLRPRSANRLLQAWCEQSHAQGGWTVIQRRQDGSVNFFRTWEQYKQGFGNLDGEYWLGLEHLYWLTKQAQYKLRVALEDWQGRQVFAEYDSFHLEPESDWYRLRLGKYLGNAGDSLSWHNNKAFTTLDRDKDGYSGNCAHYQKGGWWYHMCAHSNLNGVWYRGGHYRSLPVILSPAEVVVRYGDPVEINCTSLIDVAGIGWEASVGEPPDVVSVSKVGDGPMTEGIKYTLKCDIKNVAPVQLQVKWYKGNETLLSNDYQQADVYPANVSVYFYGTATRDDHGSVFRKDSGVYTAEIANTIGNTSTNVSMTLGYKPSLICREEYEVEVNSEVKDLCEPQGSPKPSVTWFREGQMFSRRWWSKQDAGEYSVKATNQFGTAEHKFNLHILYAPEFTGGNVTKEFVQSGNVTLNCSAEGNPSPVIHWLCPTHTNVQMSTVGRYNIITVTQATSSNAGVYGCVATNKVGNVTRFFSLVEKGKTDGGSHDFPEFLLIILIIIILVLLIVIDQYDIIEKHTQSGLELVEKYVKFVKERTEIEQNYAKQLRLSSYQSFLDILNETNDYAGQRELIAENLMMNICIDLTKYLQDLKQERKTYLLDAKKAQQNLESTYKQLDSSKKRFEREWREAERAAQYAEKTDQDINATKADVEKAKQQAHMRAHIADECKNDYAAQLQKYNKEQSQFYFNDMPLIFNDLDERRIRKLAQGYLLFSDTEKLVMPIIGKCLEGITKAGTNVNEKNQNKSGFERPGDLEFEDYSQGINRASSDSSLGTPKGPLDLLGKNKSKNFWLFSKRSKLSSSTLTPFSTPPAPSPPNGFPSPKFGRDPLSYCLKEINKTVKPRISSFRTLRRSPTVTEDFAHLPPEQRRKRLQQKFEEICKELQKEVDQSEALGKMKDVYEKNPQMGDPASLASQISQTSQNIDRLKGELNKYETWLTEAGGRGDTLRYKAHAFNNNGVHDIHSPDGAHSDESTPDASQAIYAEFDDDFEDEELAPPIGKCTAMYNFPGASEGTISMQEGEVLAVVEEDKGDGWTRVRRNNGDEGYIPTSYVTITLNK